jgi:hypothetical protein
VILDIALVILVMVLLAVSWQEVRYLRIRCIRAQGYQKMFHSGDAFHVITFFRLRDGDKLVDTARHFVQQVSAAGNVRLIYAGQAAFIVNSEQLGRREWDGVLLLEYAARMLSSQFYFNIGGYRLLGDAIRVPHGTHYCASKIPGL